MSKEKGINWGVLREREVHKQLVIYLIFALLMIVLNYLIQKTNQIFLYPYICNNFGHLEFIHTLYCSIDPINMAELLGSIVAVGICYIIKFFLDKYVVFKKSGSNIKDTSQEFFKYFAFAILTTLLNIGIQFLMTNFVNSPLELSMIVALVIGYTVKFFLDRKYVFTKDYNTLN
ncbi:MAG: GtrA family protein [Candidatus Lokiarchaeota archaeon]|nr:GtrA family protein [Candidatus Lokiarchaeota archaeon]